MKEYYLVNAIYRHSIIHDVEETFLLVKASSPDNAEKETHKYLEKKNIEVICVIVRETLTAK